MLVCKKFNNELDFLNFLRGDTVVTARTGSNGAGAATFTDATGTPFASAAIGDVLHISGDATPHVITVATDDTNIDVSPVIAAAHAGVAYRLLRGGTALADIEVGPSYDPVTGAVWVIYDEVSFG